VRSAPRPCNYYRAGGWLQPTQGVYQDERIFPFVTHGIGGIIPTKNPQLEQIDARGTYMAWLPMIAGRDSVVIGADRYRKKDGSIVPVADRLHIVVRGKGNCTGPVPVKLRFTLEDSGGARTLWVSEIVGVLPLEGPVAEQENDFEIRYFHGDGVPPRDVGAFKIEGRNGSPYSISAQLIRADNGLPTGLMVSVGGTVEEMHPPSVKVVPLVLNDAPVSEFEADGLDLFAERLARAIELFVPDYYPLAPGSISAFAGKALIGADLDPAKDAVPDERLKYVVSPEIRRLISQDIFESRLNDRLGTAGMLGGADRIIAVLRDRSGGGSDMERLADNAAGLIGSTKVLYVAVYPPQPLDPGERPRTGPASELEKITKRPGGSRSRPPGAGRVIHVTAHEIAHSLPDKLWSGETDARHSMMKSCGATYHNSAAGWAFGLRLTNGGAPQRSYQSGVTSFMGPSDERPRWVDQCTYAHLISAMREKPDPELFLVRAFLSRIDGGMRATLAPGYDLPGIADIASSGTGSWSLRALDRRGRVLATYPFEPVWESEEKVPRQVISLAYRIPATPDIARIDLRHGERVLASRDVSARKPALSVSPPQPDPAGKSASVAWTVRTQAKAPVLATVLYSADRGKTFDEQLFEKPVQQAAVALDPAAAEHTIKVIVTDGARSAEQTVRLAGTGDGKPRPVLPEDDSDW
jgi:hypothetical protein